MAKLADDLSPTRSAGRPAIMQARPAGVWARELAAAKTPHRAACQPAKSMPPACEGHAVRPCEEHAADLRRACGRHPCYAGVVVTDRLRPRWVRHVARRV